MTADNGRLIDIGGRCLYATVAGQGTPPVVFDGGLGCAVEKWGALVERTADVATVVAYDRANVGRSHAAPAGRTALDCAADLRALLRALDVLPPYVLVGHSLGGAHALAYAGAFPEEVAGLVLIDPVHEDQSDRIRALLPPDAIERSLRIARGENIDGLNPERLDRLTSDAQVGNAPLSPVPTVVISHGGPQPEIPNALVPVDVRERLFHELQRDLVRRIPGARHELPGRCTVAEQEHAGDGAYVNWHRQRERPGAPPARRGFAPSLHPPASMRLQYGG